jgi:hypothetical protein
MTGPEKRESPSSATLGPKHYVKHLMILSRDRDSEVQHLADIVGITDVRSSLKLKIVRAEIEKT